MMTGVHNPRRMDRHAIRRPVAPRSRGAYGWCGSVSSRPASALQTPIERLVGVTV
jgi:hypothetical protein